MFVYILPKKGHPEMTYTVLGGTLNPTHSLTHSELLPVFPGFLKKGNFGELMSRTSTIGWLAVAYLKHSKH